MTGSPQLSIIIVNWNAGELLERCILSIAVSQPQTTYEIIVVDNASTDSSLQFLLKKELAARLINEDRLHFIENSENQGFGKANNQAFALTTSPLVMLLNPDTEILPNSIDNLVATIRSNSRIGACGPKILNSDGSVQVSVWRNPPSAWEILLSNLRLYLFLPKYIRGELLLGGHWAHNRRRDVRMLSAAALLVRREVINEIGGFDERFHMYGEDNEWCLRMVRAGWQLVFEPAARVLHHGAQSATQRWSKLEKLRVQLDASYLFQELYLKKHQLVANQMASYMTASLQHLWRRMRGINAPELRLAKQVHLEHLKSALYDRLPSSNN